MRRTEVACVAMMALGSAVAGVVPASAAGGVLLPHPGPDGLVWVEERTGDGGVVSGGAHQGLPTVLTVACEGGGSVRVTMESQQVEVGAFAVECPAGGAATGSLTMDAGVVLPGSFSVVVDASAETVRWALTVTQPE
ncbi:hypothetical protein ACF1G0_31535 [Streptomyces sp. NPDC013953]|uniref:hypothetical protein n=1 Tax=Streptomyces sp. NPDC013953 TaxID=3364868 RepID=UPI0036F8D6DB